MTVRLSSAALVAIVLAACSGGEPSSGADEFRVYTIAFPGGADSGQARFSVDVDGAPVLSWLEPEGEGDALRYARFAGGAFGPVQTVTSGTDFFLNWADTPSVQPITPQIWAAHWLKLVPESSAYHVATSVSADGGRSWSAAVQLNDDSAEAEHGFVQLFKWDDAIGALWLDGRQLAEFSFDEPNKLLGTSLRVARLDASGAVIARDVVDELVCDCCQPHLAMTSAGPVVAYRDRTPEEIRDIVVRRYEGAAWSDAVPVAHDHWNIEGCPVNGPAIAATADEIAVAWFTAAGDMPRVRLARSRDGARTFAPAVDIDGAGSFGQVGLLLEHDGAAVVTWWRRAAGGGMDLAARKVGADGALGEIRVLAHSSEGQPVDVPQLIAAGDARLVAWTSVDEPGTVHTLSFDAGAL